MEQQTILKRWLLTALFAVLCVMAYSQTHNEAYRTLTITVEELKKMLPLESDRHSTWIDVGVEGAYYVETWKIHDYNVFRYIKKKSKKMKKSLLDNFQERDILIANLLLSCDMEWKVVYKYGLNEAPVILTQEDMRKAVQQ